MSEFNLDDDDLEMDDLWDDDFGMEDMTDDRKPMEAIMDGALDEMLNRDTQADIARIVLENSLPDGYGTALTASRNLVRDAKSLYNETKKQLKGPFDDIRKDLAKMAENSQSDTFMGVKTSSIASFLKPEEDTRTNLTSSDPKEQAVDAMLNSIFAREEANRQQDLKLSETEMQLDQQNTNSIVNELNRLTAFQDSIQYNYMRKSLELQQRGFFLQQELVGITKAYAADSQTANKALVKNTALPDFAKATLWEGYSEEAQGRIFGKITEKSSDYFRKFGGRLQENIENRLKGIAENIASFASEIGEATSAFADMGDEINPWETVGGLGVGMTAEFAGEALGDKFRRLLNKYPQIAKYGQELMFYVENYPYEIEEALDNWDGGFPQEVVQKFPFLGRIRSEVMADELRALIPRMDDIRLGINNNLAGDGATKERFFDEITRKSIVEIIPGFLSRILEQTMIFNNGPGVERVVYDISSEQFTTEKQAAENALNLIQGANVRTRKEQELDVMRLLNGGKPMDPKLVDTMIDTITEFRQEGKELNAFSLVDHFYAKGDDRMGHRINRTLERVADDREGQDDIINRLAASQDSGLRKELIVKDMFRRINPKERQLSPEIIKAVDRWLTDHALDNRRPRIEEMDDEMKDNGVDPSIIKEIHRIIDGSENADRENDRIVSRAARDTGDVFHAMQGQINRYYSAGAKDILDSSGIVVRNQVFRGRNEIDEDLMYNRQYVPKRSVNPFEEMQSNGRRPNREERQQLDYSNVEAGTAEQATVTPTGAATAFDFWKMFTVIRNKVEGVPVHVVSNLGIDEPGAMPGQQGGPDGDSGQWRKNMYDMVERGFITQAELLDMIFRKDLTVEIPPQEGLFSKIISGGSKVSAAGLNFLSAYTTGIYNVTSSGIGAIGNIGGGALNAVGGALGFFNHRMRPRDIYVAGIPEPVITAGELKAGKYIDESTGKRIRSLNDITGRVIDDMGEEIISAEDAAKNLYDKRGGKLSALTNVAGTALGAIRDVTTFQLGLGLDMAKFAITTPFKILNKVMDRPRNIYLKGELDIPVLSGQIMKRGGYFTENGTPVLKPSDIDGQVYDRDGEIVLSHGQILRGLVDRNNVAIDTPRAFAMAKRAAQLSWSAIKGSVGLTASVVKSSVDIGLAVLRGGIKAPLTVLDAIRGKPGSASADLPELEENASLSDQYLRGILTFMMERWPLDTASPTEVLLKELVDQGTPKKTRGDTDGDGDRDNSLADRIAQRRDQKPEDIQEMAKAETQESDGPWGKILAALGILGTSLAGIKSAVGGFFDRMAAVGGAKAAGGILGDIADGVDLPERGARNAGKAGKLGRFATKAVQVTKGIGTSVVARTVGTQVLKKGGIAAAGAIAGGVIAPALAVAGAAWTVWEVGNYLFNHSEAEELEKLRFMQYGLDPENRDYRAAIRKTEDDLEEYIQISPKEIKMDNQSLPWEDIADYWGVDLKNQADHSYFIYWISQRVIPVFTKHYEVAYGIDPGIDLLDIDDEIDEGDIITFLNGVRSFSGKEPLKYTGRSAPMIDRLISEAEVAVYHDALIAKYTKATDTSDVTSKSAKTLKEKAETDGVMSQQAAFKAYADAEKAKMQAAAQTTQAQPKPANTPAQGGSSAALNKLRSGVMSREEQRSGGKVKMIKPTTGRLTSPFGNRKVGSRMKMHKGVDWADYEGAPIVAAADGIIVRRMYSSSYGKVIYISHGRYYTRYAHMHSFGSFRKGDKVKQGDMIGTQGNTGESRGVHLHFEVRDGFGNDSKAYNPLDFIVNGKTEEGQAKKEEKELSQEKKVNVKETIEGVDTIETQATGMMPEDIIKTTEPTTSQPPKQKADPIAQLEVEQRNATNNELANLTKGTESGNTELKKQTKYLKSFDEKQDLIIQAIGELTAAIRETATHTAGETPKPATKKPSIGQASVTPSVDLGT